MAVAEGLQVRTGVGTKRSYRFRYDFAVQGGTTGAKTLVDAVTGSAMQLPDNFEIMRAYAVSVTAFSEVSGTPTMKLGITGNDDCFIAATAFSNAAYAGSDKITALTAELPLKTSAAVSVLGTIATNDLDAGVVDVIVEGYEGV